MAPPPEQSSAVRPLEELGVRRLAQLRARQQAHWWALRFRKIVLNAPIPHLQAVIPTPGEPAIAVLSGARIRPTASLMFAAFLRENWSAIRPAAEFFAIHNPVAAVYDRRCLLRWIALGEADGKEKSSAFLRSSRMSG